MPRRCFFAVVLLWSAPAHAVGWNGVGRAFADLFLVCSSLCVLAGAVMAGAFGWWTTGRRLPGAVGAAAAWIALCGAAYLGLSAYSAQQRALYEQQQQQAYAARAERLANLWNRTFTVDDLQGRPVAISARSQSGLQILTDQRQVITYSYDDRNQDWERWVRPVRADATDVVACRPYSFCVQAGSFAACHDACDDCPPKAFLTVTGEVLSCDGPQPTFRALVWDGAALVETSTHRGRLASGALHETEAEHKTVWTPDSTQAPEEQDAAARRQALSWFATRGQAFAPDPKGAIGRGFRCTIEDEQVRCQRT